MSTQHLKLSDVIKAFDELGGEADWHDVVARVTEKRGNNFAPYKDWHNYKTTMFQIVQEHCEGYGKFKGDIQFVQVRKTRFRLASPSPTVTEPHPLSPKDIYPDTVPEGKEYVTGATRQVLINAYERDPEARKERIKHYRAICAVCSVNFAERYGRIGKGFIHVHHRKPLATREVYILDPINDLIPVCPNCHSMLHTSDPPLSIEELKALMAETRFNSALNTDATR